MRYLLISTLTMIIAIASVFMTTGINSDASFIVLSGQASWYSEFSPGIRKTTANMEIFNHDMMTCAMWGVPFNTLVKVTNVYNDRSVILRVNDRGPAKRLCRDGRVIDLTMNAFRSIADLDEGLVDVEVSVIGKAEI